MDGKTYTENMQGVFKNQKKVCAQRLTGFLFLTVFLYSLNGLMAPFYNQLQCSTKTVFVSSCREIRRVWTYVFKFPSRTGCSTLVPTAGKAESAHWTLQKPALNVHGVWHTPQPQLCLSWVQCTLSDPQAVRGISSKNNPFFFFLLNSSRHCLEQPRSENLKSQWFNFRLIDRPVPDIDSAVFQSSELRRNDSHADVGKPSGCIC